MRRRTCTSMYEASGRGGRAELPESAAFVLPSPPTYPGGSSASWSSNVMNAYLRDKLLQKLETVSDERGYQVLDYVEFLESKYAERPGPGATTTNPLGRFADAVEEKLRAGK